MSVFSVGGRQFNSLPEFHEYLNGEEVSFHEDLYIMVGFTQYSESELMSILEGSGYEILGEHGEISRLEITHQDIEVQFYIHYADESGIILIYSDMSRGDELKPTIERFLEEHQGVHYLYIGPSLFRDIRDNITSEYELVQITRFIADRTDSSDYPSRIRPDYWRTITYHGADGLKALQEMERNYGVRPKNLTFNLPNKTKFRVIRRGIFAVERGNLDIPFRYIEFCIEETLPVLEAHENSSFQMTPASDTLSVPSSRPVTVDLSGELKYHEMPDLTNLLGQNDYVVVNSYAQEGSLYFSSKIIDKKKQDVFKVKASENQIRVFPQEEEKDLGSFYRFYEFIQENVDQDAEVRSAA